MKYRRWFSVSCVAISLFARGSAALDGQWTRAGGPHRSDLRVDSDLVLVPVSVTDSADRPVTGLEPAAFRVFDAGKEQKIEQFASDDAPVSVGIVFDTSASMTRKLAKAKEAVAEFLKTSNPEDEFFLVSFSSTAQLVVPFTGNPGDIQSRLPFTDSWGRTALLDAAYLALQYSTRARNVRRALLVISDGGENNSRYTENEIRRLVAEGGAWIYTIGTFDRRTPILPEEEVGGPALLTRLASETGGRDFEVHDLSDLPRVAAKIGLALRNEYVLAFRPEERSGDGRYHRLQVKLVKPGHYHISSRPGYYAPAE
ncbi:MAG TPA: VWA domain-containing protein [Bryobacteraceae bacterium]|nr:VWA domain-containing protein [Bryobacteraceae bacterium]